MEIAVLIILGVVVIGTIVWSLSTKIDFSNVSEKNEPSLKEIQNILTYIKNNFVTEEKTFDQIRKEFMSENDKCYHCSSTTRAFCKKRPHSEDCQGPYDW